MLGAVNGRWTDPVLAFPPEFRKIIYTTSAIESLNYQLRKIIKNRGTFVPALPRPPRPLPRLENQDHLHRQLDKLTAASSAGADG
jgi:hypothetical protein